MDGSTGPNTQWGWSMHHINRPWFVMHAIGWVFPIMLMVVGYLIPVLHTPVFGGSAGDNLYFYLLILTAASLVWLIFDFITITSPRTTGFQLQLNAFVSSTINNILMFVTGGLMFLGTLQWWMVVPVVAQLIDDYIVGNRAITNAQQKPFGTSAGR